MRQRILIGILLSSSVVAACGSEAAVETPPGTVEVAAIEQQLLALHEDIGGTVDQNRYRYAANHFAFQESLRACMADGGYDYTPAPLMADPYRNWENLQLNRDYFGLLELADPTVGNNFAAGEAGVLQMIENRALAQGGNPGFESLDPDGQVAYGARLSECDATIPDEEAIARPDERGVGLAFEQMLEEVESLPAVRGRASEYESCMAGLGVPDALSVPEADGSREPDAPGLRGLSHQIDSLFRDAETGDPLAPGSSEWEGAVDRQNAIAEADRTCRSAIHSVALSEVSGRMEEFERDYEAELDAIARDWVEVARQSEAIIASSDPSFLTESP